MSDNDVTVDSFNRRWKESVDDLNGLGWNLGEEDRERLFELTNELEGLVKTATMNYAEKNL